MRGARTRVDVRMQLEVVLPAKELFADLALELAAPAMRGDVAPQVPLAGEHLLTHKTKTKSQQCTRDTAEPAGHGRYGLYIKHQKLTVTAFMEMMC